MYAEACTEDRNKGSKIGKWNKSEINLQNLNFNHNVSLLSGCSYTSVYVRRNLKPAQKRSRKSFFFLIFLSSQIIKKKVELCWLVNSDERGYILRSRPRSRTWMKISTWSASLDWINWIICMRQRHWSKVHAIYSFLHCCSSIPSSLILCLRNSRRQKLSSYKPFFLLQISFQLVIYRYMHVYGRHTKKNT